MKALTGWERGKRMRPVGFGALIVLAVRLGAGEAVPPELVRGTTAFAVDLYRRIAAEPGNVFFSPASIVSALAMTYAGARGTTASEMAATLRWPAEPMAVHEGFAALQARVDEIQKSGQIRLLAANSVWPHRSHPLLEEYLETLRRYYRATPTALDYVGDPQGARSQINAWVAEHTENRILNLIADPLPPSTRLVLVNAIYFKGRWERAFVAGETREEPFEVAPGQTVQVPFMTHGSRGPGTVPKFPWGDDEHVQLLELPYTGGEVAMLIVLPKARGGLREIESRLTPEQIEEWTRHLIVRPVRVFLPRFRMVWGTRELTPLLQALGIREAFQPGKADFSGMDGRSPTKDPDHLYIGQVLHKAFVEVNEEGTEAAAATGVAMRVTAVAAPEPEVVFRADHPFLFLLRDRRTGQILFLGRVSIPGVEAG